MHGEAGQVEVAAGHVVAGDRHVLDGLVDLAGGEGVAVRVAIHASNTSWLGQTVITTVSLPVNDARTRVASSAAAISRPPPRSNP